MLLNIVFIDGIDSFIKKKKEKKKGLPSTYKTFILNAQSAFESSVLYSWSTLTLGVSRGLHLEHRPTKEH